MEDESNGRERDVEGRYGALYEQRMNPFAEVRVSMCVCVRERVRKGERLRRGRERETL